MIPSSRRGVDVLEKKGRQPRQPHQSSWDSRAPHQGWPIPLQRERSAIDCMVLTVGRNPDTATGAAIGSTIAQTGRISPIIAVAIIRRVTVARPVAVIGGIGIARSI